MREADDKQITCTRSLATWNWKTAADAPSLSFGALADPKGREKGLADCRTPSVPPSVHGDSGSSKYASSAVVNRFSCDASEGGEGPRGGGREEDEMA